MRVPVPSASQPIWTRPGPGARKPRFSREQIAAAALAIADAEGFDAVSIRRVAAELSAGTMSLYRYISAKADLVALMDDAIMGESLIPDGQLPAHWRDALAMIARATRAVLLRHPWAVQSLQGRGAAAQDGAFGPNGIRHFEQSLAAVATAPLQTAAKLDLISIVDDYVFGHVLRAGEQQARAANADPEHAAAIAAYIQDQLGTGQFPHLTELARDPGAQTIVDPARLDDRFERGLQALLDGALAGTTQAAASDPNSTQPDRNMRLGGSCAPGRSSLDMACAPAEYGSYREARTGTISPIEVSTLSGEPREAPRITAVPLHVETAVRNRLAADPPGAVPVQPPPVTGQESGPVCSFADDQVDRPGGARRQRDGDDRAALSGDGQGPVPAFQAQVLAADERVSSKLSTQLLDALRGCMNVYPRGDLDDAPSQSGFPPITRPAATHGLYHHQDDD